MREVSRPPNTKLLAGPKHSPLIRQQESSCLDKPPLRSPTLTHVPPRQAPGPIPQGTARIGNGRREIQVLHQRR